jgi:hypothetical protein
MQIGRTSSLLHPRAIGALGHSFQQGDEYYEEEAQAQEDDIRWACF